MKKDWFPTKGSAQQALYLDLTTALPAIAETLELDPAFTAATVGAAQAVVDAQQAVTGTRQQARAAMKTLAAKKKVGQARVRKLAQLLRATPAATPAQLAQLHLSSAPAGAVAAQAPTLRLRLDAGQVAVRFTKHGHQGIRLYSRRGAETEFTFLGACTVVPYLDTRPHLVPGQAERRDYQAFFMDRDQATGSLSATVRLAVG